MLKWKKSNVTFETLVEIIRERSTTIKLVRLDMAAGDNTAVMIIVPDQNEEFHSRTAIRIGQCLEGVSEFYWDNDGDGLGYGPGTLYSTGDCETLLPEGYVDNNLDINDRKIVQNKLHTIKKYL